MVLYFTSTGNSLFVAKQLDDTLASIPQELDKPNRHYKADRIGIVCPTYGHEIPNTIKEFIKDSIFETDYFYIVLTYGFRHGGAIERLNEYLNSIGKHVNYMNAINMVDNALPEFDIENELKIDPDKQVPEHIATIKADIDAKKQFILDTDTPNRDYHQTYLDVLGTIVEGHPYHEFITFMERTKADKTYAGRPLYKVNDNCVGCGICARVCPMGCIEIVNKRSVHSTTDCIACLACIHACPHDAIEFAIMPEKNSKARYRNPNIKVAEIIKSNNRHQAV